MVFQRFNLFQNMTALANVMCGLVEVRRVPKREARARALEFLGKMIGVAPDLSAEVRMRLKHLATVYPNNASANYYYAMTLRDPSYRGATPESARTYLERAVRLSPSFAPAHLQLGMVYEEDGETERAIAQYQAAIGSDPRLSAAHYHLAQLYHKQGKSALAEREYSAVRSLRE